jgi:RecQ family ATP-dependent DNA helicase
MRRILHTTSSNSSGMHGRPLLPGTFVNPRLIRRQTTFSLDAILPEEARRQLEQQHAEQKALPLSVAAPRGGSKPKRPSSLRPKKATEVDVSAEPLGTTDSLVAASASKRAARGRPGKAIMDSDDEGARAGSDVLSAAAGSESDHAYSSAGEEEAVPAASTSKSAKAPARRKAAPKPKATSSETTRKRKPSGSTSTITIREKVDVKRVRRAESTHGAKASLGATSNTNYRAMNLQRRGFRGGKRGGRGGGRGGSSSSVQYTYTKVEVGQMDAGYDDEELPEVGDMPAAVDADMEGDGKIALPGFDAGLSGDEGEDAQLVAALDATLAAQAAIPATKLSSADFILSVQAAEAILVQDSEYPYLVRLSPTYMRDPLMPDEMAPSAIPVVFVDVLKALTALTGFLSFRPGQLEVLKTVLAGTSTIFVSPTGSGKSLVYQLPAFILRNVPQAQPGIILCISPMISLMQDQLRCLDKGLRGLCLSSVQQTATQRRTTMTRLANNNVDVLFITPEKLASDSFLELVRSGSIPPVRLACIDEVHCLSEWSHNFRPAYLFLHTSLRDKLHVSCILGLTGTMIPAAQRSICAMLHIEPEHVVHNASVLRPNLLSSVSWMEAGGDVSREGQLLALLQTPTFRPLRSIIIYTMFQAQADDVASYLRIRTLNAESYHAGKLHEERSRIQRDFMEGRLRIIVATVAFGLGINKADIQSVIHFSMPKSLESYLQEIGRAGRNGAIAYCHLFLSQTDYIKHRSLCFGEGMDQSVLEKFVQRIFKLPEPVGKKAGKSGASIQAQEADVSRQRLVVLPIEECERAYDMKEGVLATVLACLELHAPELGLKLLAPIHAVYTLRFCRTPPERLAESMPVVEAILRHGVCAGVGRNVWEVETLRLCDALGQSAAVVVSMLYELRRKKELTLEAQSRSFHVAVPAGRAHDKRTLELACQRLWDIFYVLENAKADKLDDLYRALSGAASKTVVELFGGLHREGESPDVPASCAPDTPEPSDPLSLAILDYFQQQSSQPRVNPGFADPLLLQHHTTMKLNVELVIRQFVTKHANITSGMIAVLLSLDLMYI